MDVPETGKPTIVLLHFWQWMHPRVLVLFIVLC